MTKKSMTKTSESPIFFLPERKSIALKSKRPESTSGLFWFTVVRIRIEFDWIKLKL